MKKIAYILIIAILGNYFIPNNSHVCGSEVIESSCHQNVVENAEKSCCKKESHQKPTKKSCDGKCNHQNCNTSNVQSFILAAEILYLKHNLQFTTEKKACFFDFKTKISSGFNKIWIPPVIA